MRLCNPDTLIQWQEIAPPKYKKDYVGQLVRVKKFPHFSCIPAHIPPDGSVCEMKRRGNFTGSGFELELSWHCPCCGYAHTDTLPETGLETGNLSFVKATGLADATQAIDDERKPMLYLGTAYSHKDVSVRNERATQASLCAAWLMRKGYSVFSPLSMGHAIWIVEPELKTEFAAWKEPCLRMLEQSDGFVVLMLDGVKESIGLAAEIEHARKLGIPLTQLKAVNPEASFAKDFEVLARPEWWV